MTFKVGIVELPNMVSPSKLIAHVWVDEEGIVRHNARGKNVADIEGFLEELRFSGPYPPMTNEEFVRSLPARINTQAMICGEVNDDTAEIDPGE